MFPLDPAAQRALVNTDTIDLLVTVQLPTFLPTCFNISLKTILDNSHPPKSWECIIRDNELCSRRLSLTFHFLPIITVVFLTLLILLLFFFSLGFFDVPSDRGGCRGHRVLLDVSLLPLQRRREVFTGFDSRCGCGRGFPRHSLGGGPWFGFDLPLERLLVLGDDFTWKGQKELITFVPQRLNNEADSLVFTSMPHFHSLR